MPSSYPLTFSGLTKGAYPVKVVEAGEDFVLLKTIVPSEKFTNVLTDNHEYLHVNGTPAWIVGVSTMTRHAIPCLELYLLVPNVLYLCALKELKNEEKASIGIQSSGEAKDFPIEGFPIGKAKLLSKQIAPGHQHTLELTFEVSVPESQFEFVRPIIQSKNWIGINGSSFTVQDKGELSGEGANEKRKIQFKIHVGQQSRRQTMIGHEQGLQVGHEVNLTPRYQPVRARL
jgi:hypothetical protein